MQAIRAAIYARVSTASQAEENKVSIPSQIAKCEELIEKNGWELVQTYTDPGYSSNTLNRPALQRLLKELGRFDVLACYDPDRISRDNALVEATIYAELDNHRIQVTSVTQPVQLVPPDEYDPRENDSVFIQRRISGLAGGLDNRRRRRRLREGMLARMKRGLMAKPRAYGYEVEWRQYKEGGKIKIEKNTVVNEHEAEVVKRIFREYVDGHSSFAIARALNREKVHPKRGKLWCCQSVRAVLKNPVYYGVVRCNYMRTVNGKRRRVPMRQWELIQGTHPAFISQEMYQKAQLVRERRQNRFRALGSPKLFSGLVRCGFCGWSMWCEGGGKKSAYACGNYKSTGSCSRNPYNRLKLEGEVIREIQEMLRSPSVIERAKKVQGKADLATSRKEIKRIEMQLSQFPERKSRIFDLYERAVITEEEFVHRRGQLEKESKLFLSELEQKRTALERYETQEITTELVQKALSSFAESVHGNGIMMEKKQKLSNLIECIELKDGQYRINFRFSPGPSI